MRVYYNDYDPRACAWLRELIKAPAGDSQHINPESKKGVNSMAATEVTISGVLYDKTQRTMRPVVLIGEASLTGLGVGGGPIYPPEGGGSGDAHPEHPIFYPPRPAHPIVLPPDRPVDPPTEPPTNPPDPAWSWCWSPQYGWHPAYVAGDKPQPPGGGKPSSK